MKGISNIVIVIALISLIAGIVSRLLGVPFRGVEAHAFLEFSGVCLLLAIALTLREK